MLHMYDYKLYKCYAEFDKLCLIITHALYEIRDKYLPLTIYLQRNYTLQ